jgi:hypothetical protein
MTPRPADSPRAVAAMTVLTWHLLPALAVVAALLFFTQGGS